MNIKQPIGECQYCGQEFMTKNGLKVHEAEKCPQRPKIESEKEQKRWRQAVHGGRSIGWMRQ